jgi:hypothetical protein
MHQSKGGALGLRKNRGRQLYRMFCNTWAQVPKFVAASCILATLCMAPNRSFGFMYVAVCELIILSDVGLLQYRWRRLEGYS